MMESCVCLGGWTEAAYIMTGMIDVWFMYRFGQDEGNMVNRQNGVGHEAG